MPIINHNGNSLFSFTLLWLKEFVPVIRFDKALFKAGKNALLSEENNAVELSDKIDAGKRRVSLISITTSPGNIAIPFKVERGMASLDQDGYLTPKISGSFKNVSITPSIPFKVCFDKSFDLTVSITGNDKIQLFVDFYANDNADDFFRGDFKNVFCGRINLKVYPDVFTEHECELLIDEINYIKPFADSGSPSEYAGNYCMSAAERGLSKLLNNTSDFYSVDRTHKRLNGISFAGKNANVRGSNFDSLGFVESSFVFKDYQINHKLRLATKNDVDFGANLYDVVKSYRNSGYKPNIYTGVTTRLWKIRRKL